MADQFYDICMDPRYNINPCFAFAWAYSESGNGRVAPGNNIFGYAIYAGDSSGKVYSTKADSLRDFLDWIMRATTPGSALYQMGSQNAEMYGEYNSKMRGTPENNIYVLMSAYSGTEGSVGPDHKIDEPDFNHPLGIEGCMAMGDYWGLGGRIVIYHMYENGPISTGEYAIRCGHSKASDPTTLQERADSYQFTIQGKIDDAKKFFGNNCFVGGGDIVEQAKIVHDYMSDTNHLYFYCLLGNSNYEYVHRNEHLSCGLNDSFEESQKPGSDGYRLTCCATYVSWVLQEAGLIEEHHNGCPGLKVCLESNGWQQINNPAELEPGDVVFYRSE